jgi:pyruvate-formate lyase-activating enzyme
LQAVFTNRNGAVLDLPHLSAAADGGRVAPAGADDFIALPEGSLLLTLPGRSVVGYDRASLREIAAYEGEEICAVAAALPLGYTRLALPAYVERTSAPALPLYGYAAVAWSDDGFRVAAQRTDHLATWSQTAHADDLVREGITQRKVDFGANPLIAQLERCATEYGCFTAQNMFLRQGEAALPVSPACNARCIGCISEQDHDAPVKSAQERIRRRPTLEELCAPAIAHLRDAQDAMISFGQGCEGEPLLAAGLIEAAIKRMRAATSRGIIHCNTNASRPQMLARLIDAGLDSVRVSLNSSRPSVYAAYYRPRGYDFTDVVASLRLAADHKIAISLNLLTHPGVTDDVEEMSAFEQLLRDVPMSMVQTRTLNVDPNIYFAAVGRPKSGPVGMRAWLEWLRSTFPTIKIGNFTRGFG